jgi:hypothetical protein
MSIDMLYMPAFTEIVGGIATEHAATYAGMTAGSWATAATIGGTVLSAASGISQSNQLKGQAKQAQAEADANAQILENEETKNKRLLENKFEREQSARNVYFGKYGGGLSALEVLSGAAESYEVDKGALETSTDMKKANIYYGADTKAKQTLARADSATASAFDSLLTGGARAYRTYKGL